MPPFFDKRAYSQRTNPLSSWVSWAKAVAFTPIPHQLNVQMSLESKGGDSGNDLKGLRSAGPGSLCSHISKRQLCAGSRHPNTFQVFATWDLSLSPECKVHEDEDSRSSNNNAVHYNLMGSHRNLTRFANQPVVTLVW